MSNNLCRVTGKPLVEILDLGNQCVSNFFDTVEEAVNAERGPLRLGIGPEGHIQLYDAYSPEKMYKKYWYASGVNEAMRQALNDVVDSCQNFTGLDTRDGDIWLDIASNDGTLLSMVPSSFERIGIDPSDVAKDSKTYQEEGIEFHNEFFSEGILQGRKAKIITIIAMFYDIEDPVDFLKQIRNILDDNGLLCIQLSYTLLMNLQKAFDNACHEHLFYYTLATLIDVLDRAGLMVYDAEINPVNAGSLRIYAGHFDAFQTTSSHEDIVRQVKVESLLNLEEEYKVNGIEGWENFATDINMEKNALISFLKVCKEEGKLVLGYGASTKGNTILQTWGITPDLLPYIAERSPKKYGTYTPGTAIPIISEEEAEAMKPFAYITFPYTFINAFLKREKAKWEGREETAPLFVAPLPEFRIYSTKDI